MKQSFSTKWVIAAVLIYTLMEIGISMFLTPLIFAGRNASPMVQMRIQMIMHLGSFLLGGFLVGIISPGVRLWEPAVGAFVAVALVFMMSLFMPTWFYHWDSSKVLIGGGIAFVLAIAGAYSGEKLMGNVEAGDGSRRGKIKERMWGEHGLLGTGSESSLASLHSTDKSTRSGRF